MRCQICGTELNGCLCPRCGCDQSQNREHYPTLANDGKQPEAARILAERFQQQLNRQQMPPSFPPQGSFQQSIPPVNAELPQQAQSKKKTWPLLSAALVVLALAVTAIIWKPWDSNGSNSSSGSNSASQSVNSSSSGNAADTSKSAQSGQSSSKNGSTQASSSGKKTETPVNQAAQPQQATDAPKKQPETTDPRKLSSVSDGTYMATVKRNSLQRTGQGIVAQVTIREPISLTESELSLGVGDYLDLRRYGRANCKIESVQWVEVSGTGMQALEIYVSDYSDPYTVMYLEKYGKWCLMSYESIMWYEAGSEELVFADNATVLDWMTAVLDGNESAYQVSDISALFQQRGASNKEELNVEVTVSRGYVTSAVYYYNPGG